MFSPMEEHKYMHIYAQARDTAAHTPLIFTHTTRAHIPFAFPTVHPCQVDGSPMAFCPFSHPSGSSFVLL